GTRRAVHGRMAAAQARTGRGPEGPRSVRHGPARGRRSRVAVSAKAELRRAGRPGAPALLGLELLGGGILLGRRGRGRAPGHAHAVPRLLRELVGPGEAVAGVGRVVATRLALAKLGPHATGHARVGRRGDRLVLRSGPRRGVLGRRRSSRRAVGHGRLLPKSGRPRPRPDDAVDTQPPRGLEGTG